LGNSKKWNYSAGKHSSTRGFLIIAQDVPVYGEIRKDVIMAENELEIGSNVPDFTLPSNKGGEVKFSDYRGRKIVLFFVREYE
jgi:hypothetical protein